MSIYDTQKRLGAMKHSFAIWPALVFLTNLSIAVATVYSPNWYLALAMIVSAAFFTLIIPYMFGVKSVKRIAAAGLAIILVVGFLQGLVYLNALYNIGQEAVGSEDGQLTMGTVSPYKSVGETNFTYSVTYNGGAPHSDVAVWLNITDIAGRGNEYYLAVPLQPGQDPQASPRIYSGSFELPASIYHYRFELEDGTNSTVTEETLGPITAPMADFIAPICLYAVMTMLLQTGMMFLIGLLMYWWLRKGRMERSKWKIQMDEPLEQKAGGFKCTSCGATVGSDDRFCPKCGEEFEEDGHDGSKAGGDDVKHDPTIETCGGCGADMAVGTDQCAKCGLRR
jgi:energy-coupling factor transporter transmembrane protein EcfT